MAEQRSYVVLVDDDPAFRELLGTVLDRAGYETVAVSSAEEALTVIDEQRPDVVVTDVGLPGVSGYELCRQIKDRGDEIGVMMISGQRMEPFDRAAGILLGADDYMVKPIDPGELVARVWRLARRSNVDHLPSPDDRALDVLSARERQVLDLLTGGSNQAEIADALFISPKTVGTHIQRVLTKLDVRSRTEAVALALRHPVSDVNGHALTGDPVSPPVTT